VSQAQPSRPMPEPGGPCARRYVDDSGVAWCVHEYAYDDHAPALYFESIGSFRRVRAYPVNWVQLTSDQLEVLSHKT
jgi:hypothetical protein